MQNSSKTCEFNQHSPYLLRMKRMELQSFYLKLSELKEYEQAKEERRGDLSKDSFIQTPPEKPLVKGPKTKAEIQARIGLNMNTS